MTVVRALPGYLMESGNGKAGFNAQDIMKRRINKQSIQGGKFKECGR